MAAELGEDVLELLDAKTRGAGMTCIREIEHRRSARIGHQPPIAARAGARDFRRPDTQSQPPQSRDQVGRGRRLAGVHAGSEHRDGEGRAPRGRGVERGSAHVEHALGVGEQADGFDLRRRLDARMPALDEGGDPACCDEVAGDRSAGTLASNWSGA